MRTDMDKLICERQRINSGSRSHKTGLRLPLIADFEDYDSGPQRLSSARHRQEYGHLNCKRLNENLSPLKRYLYASIGRPWDDVYSEIRANIDMRKAIGLHVMQHLWQYVERFPDMVDGVPHYPDHKYRYYSELDGMYVHPETGLLCNHERKERKRPAPEVTQIHWHGGFYFELITLKKSVCGCTTERVEINEAERKYHSRRHRRPEEKPKPCQHGNPLVVRKVWFVVEYAYHDPAKVFMVYHYENCNDRQREMWGLKEPGDKHVIRYGDKPDLMAKSFEVRRKTANKRELKMIRLKSR